MRSALVLTVAALALFSAPQVSAQDAVNPTIRQPNWKTPKTSWGAPDLEGNWSNATLTPLTRNRLVPKATLTLEEARQMEKVFAKALADSDAQTDPDKTTEQVQAEAQKSELLKIRPDFAAAGGDVGGYNSFWIDPGSHIMEINGEFRTSILTTPNGQFPPRKAGAPSSGMSYRDAYDSYEVRGLGDRCIMGFGRNAGPPMLSNGYYNNSYQIVQSPESVAIVVEMIHDVRIVRLNAKHRTDGLRPWMGDSIGWYDGDTLVVETTNIPEGQALAGSWKNMKVTERFTRVSKSRLNYQFTVEDPDVWDKPWGGEYNFYPLNGQVYEYACHEGNYALPGILSGARLAEKKAAEDAAAKAAAAAPPTEAKKGKTGGR